MPNSHGLAVYRRALFNILYFVGLPILFSMIVHGSIFWYAAQTRLNLPSRVREPERKSVMLVEVKKKEKEPPLLRKALRKGKLEPIRSAPKWAAIKANKPRPLAPKSITPVRPAMPKAPLPSATAGKGNLKILTSVPAAQLPSSWLKVDTSLSGSDLAGGFKQSDEEKSPETYGAYVQGVREQGLDVVIVLDATSSMDVPINQIKLNIEALIQAIRKLSPVCRVGIVAFRDHDDAYLTKALPLTYNIPAVKEFLKGIRAAGGGDVPEAVDEGIRVAINTMKWRSGSRSFILLIGDASPHDKDMRLTLEMATSFRSKRGGCISALDVSTNAVSQEVSASGRSITVDREKVLPAFKSIAKAGGGEAGRLVTQEALVRNMLLYIFGTKWEAYLTELMRDL